MPTTDFRQLIKGLVLLSGMLLVACAEPREEPPAPPEPAPQPVVEAEPVQPIIAVEPEAPAETVVYEPEHPQTYIVQEGDNLYKIAKKFK